MLFLIVGLGSMGKRRIRNLQFLGYNNIIGFDSRADRREEAKDIYKIKTFENFDTAIAQNPDAIIISTPPNYHIQYAKEAVKRSIHFFMEVTVDDKIHELINLCKNKKIITASSSTLRFKQSVKKMKELIEQNTIGKVIAFNYHMGQYLPDWHPWENVKSFYVGKRETGACREMFCFETSWLTWVFGSVDELACIRGKFSSLDADIDDVYAVLFKFKKKIIGTFLLDVVSRIPYRILKILGEEGVMVWDFDSLKVYTTKDKKWNEYKDAEKAPQKNYWAKDDMYIEEMKHFIAAIEGKEEYLYKLQDEEKIYNLLITAEKSSDDKRNV